MKTRITHIGAILTFAACVAPPTQLSAEASRPSRRDPSVTVTAVVRAPIVDSVLVTGTLVAKEEVLIAPQIDGFAVNEILVEEGDSVKAGQVLARLSRETLDAALLQNTAQIARAEAAIAAARSAIIDAEAARQQAQASFQRTQALRTEGIASAEVFDQRQALARQTAARVTSAQEQLRLSEADKLVAEAQRADWMIKIARTEVRSPFDGVISRRTARLGAIAAASAGEPLFRLIRDGAVELEADIAEQTMARIRPGQVAKVQPAGRDDTVKASVRLVSPEINRGTRLGRVRLAIDNSGPLIVGSFARGEIEIDRRDAVVAPLSAVLFTTEGPRVQVVKDGVVESRAVETGIRAGGRIEVRGGLAEGETVVSISGTFLRAGDRVTPIRAE
jgi:HlyD family secretion protein